MDALEQLEIDLKALRIENHALNYMVFWLLEQLQNAHVFSLSEASAAITTAQREAASLETANGSVTSRPSEHLTLADLNARWGFENPTAAGGGNCEA